MAQRRNLRAVPETARRAGLYARVSDVHGRSGERFLSPDQQMDAMRDYCQRAGWIVTETWIDLDKTGRNLDRPGIQKAVAAIECGQIEALVVYDLSRLARDVLGGLTIMRRVDDAGGTFVSVHEHIDGTPTGKHTAHTMLSVAQLISDQMGQRWRDTHRRVFEQGRVHGPAPLGYVKGGDGGLEVDLTTGPLVRAAFAGVASGLSVQRVTADLSRGLGRPVHRNPVRKLLANPVYRGLVCLNGHERPGRHVALVDEQTWQRVQRRLLANAITPKRHVAAAWSLGGIAVCDSCGEKVSKHVVRRTHGGGKVGEYARCLSPGRMPDEPRCSGFGTPRLDAIEAEVLRQVAIKGRRLRDDVDERLARRARQQAARVDVATLDREIGKVREAIARNDVAWAMREVTRERSEETGRRLTERLDALVAQHGEAAEVVDLPPARPAASLMTRLLELWPKMNPEERRAAIRPIVTQVRVRPPSVPRSHRWAHDMTDRIEVRFR